jgi:hydrogenase expression/formation protein HypC
MCLGIPAKIIERYEKEGTQMGKVDFGGVLREVCFETLPEAVVGEYAIVHVGFAISSLSEADAMETLELIREIEQAGEELELG